MSTKIKSWILTNSTHYESDGKLFLGQILTDPRNPESSLISGSPRTLPATLHVDTTEAQCPVISTQGLLEHSGSFWLETHGLNAGVSGEAGSLGKYNVKWEVKRLVGKITTFSMTYVEDTVLAEKDVVEYVKRRLSPFPPTLYIITGLRIFEGAKLVAEADDQSSVQGKLQADGTPHNVPIRGGMQGRVTRSQKAKQSFQSTSSFVFAYQCNRINYFPWKRMSPHTQGETASSEKQPEDTNKKTAEESVELKIVNGHAAMNAVEFGADEDAKSLPQIKITIPSGVNGDNTEVEVRYFSTLSEPPASG